MKRVLFIGQAPSRTSDPDEALSGTTGLKVAKLLGIRAEDLMLVRRVNLNHSWTGKNGKGDRFDMDEGRRSARRVQKDLEDRCVLIGRKVAACFGFRSAKLLERIQAFGVEFILLPHPSGVNRWWNDPRNVARAKRAIRRFVK